MTPQDERKKANRRSSWAFEPIPRSDNAQNIDPKPVSVSSKPMNQGAQNEVQAQVQIIPSQADGKDVNLSKEELIDAERQR